MPTTSGIYSLPAGTIVTSGDSILPSQHNPAMQDLEQGMTDRLMRDGTSPMTGDLPMGGNRVTGLAAPSADNDAARKAYVDDNFLALAGGTLTGNITLSAAAPYLSYTETDVATNIGNWAAGITDGAYRIAPRDSSGAVIGGAGSLDIERDAAGITQHVLTTQQGGEVIIGRLGGSVEADRSGYGLSRINTSGDGFTSGGSSQASLGRFFAGENGSGTRVFTVAAPTGNVLNANNSYGAISDQTLKENITPAGPQLADMMLMEVVNYNLIGDDLQQIGLIAQALELIKPGLVETDPDTGIKSIKYSVFVPILIKVVQELTARVEALEAL